MTEKQEKKINETEAIRSVQEFLLTPRERFVISEEFERSTRPRVCDLPSEWDKIENNAPPSS